MSHQPGLITAFIDAHKRYLTGVLDGTPDSMYAMTGGMGFQTLRPLEEQERASVNSSLSLPERVRREKKALEAEKRQRHENMDQALNLLHSVYRGSIKLGVMEDRIMTLEKQLMAAAAVHTEELRLKQLQADTNAQLAEVRANKAGIRHNVLALPSSSSSLSINVAGRDRRLLVDSSGGRATTDNQLRDITERTQRMDIQDEDDEDIDEDDGDQGTQRTARQEQQNQQLYEEQLARYNTCGRGR